MAAARAIAAARAGRARRSCSLQELHARGPRAALHGVSDRTLAPLGRRLADVGGAPRARRLRRAVAAPTTTGPRPQPGQFYMLAAAERWGGGEDERPFLPRAFSVAARARATATLDFMLEDVGPGTRRLAELRAGDGLWLLGPLGSGFARAARRPAPAAGRRRRRDRAAGDPGTTRSARTRAVLLGFRDAAHAAGRRR